MLHAHNRRLIARLDIKAPYLIKSIRLEGVRKLGIPQEFAKAYYETGVDELLYMDAVASLYGRNCLKDIIKETVRDIFVPLTVGGGIRSIEDVRDILSSGADKIAVNTAAVANPKLITDIAKKYGSQCVVLSVEAKRRDANSWEVYTNNGREHTGLDVIDWIKKAEALGAGEILITSVDREGTRTGFDIELVNAVNNNVRIPVIASGGMGNHEHLNDLFQKTEVSAAAMADILHYKRSDLTQIRKFALDNNMNVRKII